MQRSAPRSLMDRALALAVAWTLAVPPLSWAPLDIAPRAAGCLTGWAHPASPSATTLRDNQPVEDDTAAGLEAALTEGRDPVQLASLPATSLVTAPPPSTVHLTPVSAAAGVEERIKEIAGPETAFAIRGLLSSGDGGEFVIDRVYGDRLQVTRLASVGDPGARIGNTEGHPKTTFYGWTYTHPPTIDRPRADAEERKAAMSDQRLAIRHTDAAGLEELDVPTMIQNLNSRDLNVRREAEDTLDGWLGDLRNFPDEVPEKLFDSATVLVQALMKNLGADDGTAKQRAQYFLGRLAEFRQFHEVLAVEPNLVLRSVSHASPQQENLALRSHALFTIKTLILTADERFQAVLSDQPGLAEELVANLKRTGGEFEYRILSDTIAIIGALQHDAAWKTKLRAVGALGPSLQDLLSYAVGSSYFGTADDIPVRAKRLLEQFGFVTAAGAEEQQKQVAGRWWLVPGGLQPPATSNQRPVTDLPAAGAEEGIERVLLVAADLPTLQAVGEAVDIWRYAHSKDGQLVPSHAVTPGDAIEVVSAYHPNAVLIDLKGLEVAPVIALIERLLGVAASGSAGEGVSEQGIQIGLLSASEAVVTALRNEGYSIAASDPANNREAVQRVLDRLNEPTAAGLLGRQAGAEAVGAGLEQGVAKRLALAAALSAATLLPGHTPMPDERQARKPVGGTPLVAKTRTEVRTYIPPPVTAVIKVEEVPPLEAVARTETRTYIPSSPGLMAGVSIEQVPALFADATAAIEAYPGLPKAQIPEREGGVQVMVTALPQWYGSDRARAPGSRASTLFTQGLPGLGVRALQPIPASFEGVTGHWIIVREEANDPLPGLPAGAIVVTAADYATPWELLRAVASRVAAGPGAAAVGGLTAAPVVFPHGQEERVAWFM